MYTKQSITSRQFQTAFYKETNVISKTTPASVVALLVNKAIKYDYLMLTHRSVAWVFHSTVEQSRLPHDSGDVPGAYVIKVGPLNDRLYGLHKPRLGTFRDSRQTR